MPPLADKIIGGKMENINLFIGIYFTLFFILAAAQDTYMDNFQYKGAGPKIYKVTTIYRVFNIIFGLFILIISGIKIIWYYPILLIVFAFLFNLLLERHLKISRYDTYLCAIGYIGIPILTILMISKIF